MVNEINEIMDENDKNSFNKFLAETIIKIVQYHHIPTEHINSIIPAISFASSDCYAAAIEKIDPEETYTNEEGFRGVGKTIFKNGENYVVANINILLALIKSNFNDSICKYTVFHEIGHCVNNILNPNLKLPKKPTDLIPLNKLSYHCFLISVDEFLATNYITFLLSNEDCIELVKDNTLFADIDNIYSCISSPYDLITRFWNSPNAILINLFRHLPLFSKANYLKKHKILESMNINGIIAMLGKIEHQLDPLYNHLLGFFNAVVKNYNSNNPPVLQKSIST
jgi:hypothetical protein